MWCDLPHDPEDPKTWIQAVVRLHGYGHEPFRKAVNTPGCSRRTTSARAGR
ncbi:Hypothetical protein CAP_1447 [Chondromyces apiculatus DSM 436]|uniref:Uncharacterized protein n=1 Tax=Chondromyces apiculatus DSM 436 TaxID=1192034 RepID=A0A017TD54_9BACT|nr:Hypothetical protein CAP_1447 [Chondromyces apiculatus DSM 436]